MLRSLLRLAIAGLLIGASCFAQTQDGVVQKASAQVESFLGQLSDVKCTEHVLQEKLTPNGKNEYQVDSTFDYLVIMQAGSDDMLLNESRLAVRQPRQGKNFPMLITNGFSTLFLVFHPYYHESFRFQVVGDEQVGAARLTRVHFEHIPGTRTPAALAVRGREYPLELSGTAWIDPQTGAISRIESGLANSMEDVGLKKFETEVDYAPTKLPGLDRNYYFPVRARVEVQSLRQHWVNLHTFSDYKRFSVSTDVAISEKR